MQGPLLGESMVLGVYSYPYGSHSYSEKRIYYTAIEPVFIGFPAKYLTGGMSPVRPYIPAG